MFWLLVALAFIALLFAVIHVSRRSSQVEPAGAPAAPAAPAASAWQPPAPRPRVAPTSGALYKCVDAKGHPSFQSQPCPADATQAWVRDATPEPPPTRVQQQARARQSAQRKADARSAQQTFDPGTGSGAQGSTSSAACQAARAADAAYRRQPLRYVTHDGLRRHGDAILAACY